MEKCKHELEETEMAQRDTIEGSRASPKRKRSERLDEGGPPFLPRKKGRSGRSGTPKATDAVQPGRQNGMPRGIKSAVVKEAPTTITTRCTTTRSTSSVPACTTKTTSTQDTMTLSEAMRCSGDGATERLKRRADAYAAAVQSEWSSRVHLTSVSSLPVEYEEEL